MTREIYLRAAVSTVRLALNLEGRHREALERLAGRYLREGVGATVWRGTQPRPVRQGAA